MWVHEEKGGASAVYGTNPQRMDTSNLPMKIISNAHYGN